MCADNSLSFGIKVNFHGRDSSVILHFWSKKKLDLKIKDIKLFNKVGTSRLYVAYIWVHLNAENPSKDCPIEIAEDTCNINFVVQDTTSKKQHGVSISLETNEITYTDMFYEGT